MPEENLRPSDDATLIADGLYAVAEAIEKLAKVVGAEEYDDPAEETTYMDGKPVR